MRLVKLGDLASVVRGSSPRPMGDPRYFGGNIPWVKISDVTASNGRTLLSTKEGVTPEGRDRSRLVKEGDLIVSNSGSVGKPIFMGIEGCIHDGFLTFLDISPDITKEWIYWFFIWFKDRIESKANTGTQLNLNTSIVKSLQIPLPPLETQQKIAAILDQADALRQNDRQILDHYDRLAQSVFLEMFGDPGKNTKNWPIVCLSDIILSGPQNGIYKPSKDYGKGVPIIRIDSFNNSRVDIKSLKRVALTECELQNFEVREGDFLINRVNSLSHLGKCGLIPPITEKMVFESNMMRVRFTESQTNVNYMLNILSSTYVKNQILSLAKDAVNQSSINQKDVNSIKIPLPPIALQKRFAKIIHQIEQQKQITRQSLQKSEELFQSLLQRAFRGELG